MPWAVKKSSGKGWDIIKSDTGAKVGHSDTKAQAQASVRARYANTPGGTEAEEAMILRRSNYRCNHCQEKIDSEDLYPHLRDQHQCNGIKISDYQLVYTWRGPGERVRTDPEIPGQEYLWE